MAEEWLSVWGSGARLYVNDPYSRTWVEACNVTEPIAGLIPESGEWLGLCPTSAYHGPGSNSTYTPPDLPADSAGGGGGSSYTPPGTTPPVTGGSTDGGTAGLPTTEASLPWDLLSEYPNSRPVMAHYFTQFPLRHSNTSTPAYYINNWLKPGAIEQGTDHRVYGGWLRDIPFNRPVLGSDWKLQDMRKEIQWALDAKIDGFFVDLLSLDPNSSHWQNLMLLFDASDAEYAASGRRCWIAPMPDGTAGPCNTSVSGTTVNISASATTLVNAILTMKNKAALWKPWGKFVLPIFGPEKFKYGISNPSSDRITYWTKVKNDLAAAGLPTDLWACYVDNWTNANCAPAFNNIVIGHGRWGGRDDVDTASTNNTNGGAAAYCHSTYNRKWMHFGAPGDTRPRDKYPSSTNYQGYRVWEPRGSKTFHNTMTAAINGSDMIQMTTWNDFSEHAHIVPSRNNSYVWVDLLTYYISKYKTGSFPAIQRDALYLIHRVHPYGLHSFTGMQTKFAIKVGQTPQLDIAEVRAFCISSGTVEFLVNGAVTSTQAVVAGDNRLEFALPASGVISARLKRNNAVVDRTTVTSDITLGTAQIADDFHPRCFSSLRQNPPSTVTTPPSPALPPGSGRVLFEDQFSTTAINTTKWNVRSNTTQSDMNGKNLAANCTILNGALTITSGHSGDVNYPWTCGYLDTIGKFAVKNGRWEARMRFPWGETAYGYWPRFWLRPSDGGIGEIDIMEGWPMPNDVHQTVWRDYTGTPSIESTHLSSPSFDPTQWHVYAVEKVPGELRFYVDDGLVWTVTPSNCTWFTETFDRDVTWNIRLNLQIGGGYGDTPTVYTTLTQTFDIDYVRVLEIADFVVGETKPDYDNTGVPDGTTLTSHVGDLDITVDGTIVQNMDISGFVYIRANNVTLKNCIIRGRNINHAFYTGPGGVGTYGLINCRYGKTGTQIEFCDIRADYPEWWINGVDGGGVTIHRCNISGVVDAVNSKYSNVTLTGSFLHDFFFSDQSTDQAGSMPPYWTHNDGVQLRGGSNYHIEGNYFYWYPDLNVPNGRSRNAVLGTGYPSGPSYYNRDFTSPYSDRYIWGSGVTISPDDSAVTGVTITKNWFEGGTAGFQMGYLYNDLPSTVGEMSYNRFGMDQLDFDMGAGVSQYQIRYKDGATFTGLTTNTFDYVGSVPVDKQGDAFAVGTSSGIRIDP